VAQRSSVGVLHTHRGNECASIPPNGTSGARSVGERGCAAGGRGGEFTKSFDP